MKGAKFRRNHPFGMYICDFYCDEFKLVVECDGGIHNTPGQQKHDQKRDAYLRSQGLTVLRFANSSVLEATEAVLEQISACLAAPGDRHRKGCGEGD